MVPVFPEKAPRRIVFWRGAPWRPDSRARTRTNRAAFLHLPGSKRAEERRDASASCHSPAEPDSDISAGACCRDRWFAAAAVRPARWENFWRKAPGESAPREPPAIQLVRAEASKQSVSGSRKRSFDL